MIRTESVLAASAPCTTTTQNGLARDSEQDGTQRSSTPSVVQRGRSLREGEQALTFDVTSVSLP